jgi:hypothetical protein
MYVFYEVFNISNNGSVTDLVRYVAYSTFCNNARRMGRFLEIFKLLFDIYERWGL